MQVPTEWPCMSLPLSYLEQSGMPKKILLPSQQHLELPTQRWPCIVNFPGNF